MSASLSHSLIDISVSLIFLGIHPWGIHVHFLCWPSTGSGDLFIMNPISSSKANGIVSTWNLHINYINSKGIHISTLGLSSFKCKPKKKDFLFFFSYSWVIWFCFFIIMVRLQNLSYIPPLFHVESLIFIFQLFANIVWSSLHFFGKEFILKPFLFSSKLELPLIS